MRIMKLSPNTIFISLFFMMVFAGFAFPQLGPILKPFIVFLVGLIIFLSVIAQKMEKIISSAFELRKIIITIFFAFAIMPVIFFSIAKMFFSNSPGLAIGLIAVGVVSCPAGTPIIWTEMSKGNTSLALLLSVVSLSASVVITPFLILFFVGSIISIDPTLLFLTLFEIIIIPLVIAVLIMKKSKKVISTISPYSTYLSLGAGLIVILTAAAIASPVLIQKGVFSLFLCIIACGFCLAIGWLLCLFILPKFVYRMEDIVALGFTSILKNLMVPIIIIAALPPKYEEGAIIPITFFLLQSLCCVLMAPRLEAVISSKKISFSHVLTLPEDQRKTILAITRKNKFTLDEIAEETGRTKEEEKEILKELVKNGHLSEIRLGLRKYYKIAYERRSKRKLPLSMWV